MIPYYVNCQNEEIFVCDWYMSLDCKETCAYAKDIGGLGIGAVDSGTAQGLSDLEKEIEDETRNL